LKDRSKVTATEGFFRALGDRRHEPSLQKATGTMRFDLADGTSTERWLLTLDKGDVSVSRKNLSADCVVRTERTIFDAMVRGDVNGMAAYLRGDLAFEGDPELLVLFQRMFPPPATPQAARAGRRPRAKAGQDQ
jgi:putative sterol carrier protein